MNNSVDAVYSRALCPSEELDDDDDDDPGFLGETSDFCEKRKSWHSRPQCSHHERHTEKLSRTHSDNWKDDPKHNLSTMPLISQKTVGPDGRKGPANR